MEPSGDSNVGIRVFRDSDHRQIALKYYRPVLSSNCYNNKAVVPASHKRRRQGNLLQRLLYGYKSSATLTTDRLHYKLQTCPMVRECRIITP
jgi:hypothetical protein